MHTFMAVIALTTGLTTSNIQSNPAWLTDYGAARERVTAVGKPMAVFVASGQDGWTKVVRDGALSPDARKLLIEKYVCLYVNTETTAGRSLAGAFQVARGLVISDRAGTSQAYSLSGDLTGTELVQALERYADRDIRTTETIVREAPATVRPAVSYQVQPTYYAPQYAPQYVPQYRYPATYTTGST
ncbi:MAG TPA: hypothetical protein VKD90_12095 [Gemmataceae bacterium]|nr:hypothetical protein [Gemmataceae bacterium]